MIARIAALATLAAGLALIALPARSDDNVVIATVTVSDVAVEITVAKQSTTAGQPFQITAAVLGSAASEGTLRLHLDSSTIHVHGDLATGLRGGRRQAKWLACADSPGRYVLMASFETPGGIRVESPATLVNVLETRRASCPF